MGEEKEFTPEEIVESRLGRKVTKEDYVVVTVPVYFQDGQRQSMKDAGVIAGLSINRIINEPTAASLCYNLQEKSKDEERNILVFDISGKQ